MKFEKRGKVLFRFVVLVFVGLMFVYLPAIHLKQYDEISLIYRTFIGEKSEYQGMIEVWNIDSFEAGNISKTSILESRAKAFQTQHKGLYFMIRNVTENECFNMLKSGQKPDLFSCSYVVAENIKDYIQEFEDKETDIHSNFLNAGKHNGLQYGLPWCAGLYFLISTKSKLEKAGKDIEGVKLLDIAFDSSYRFKEGKKEILSYSLTFGTNGKLMPKNAISSYNKNSIVQENGIDIDAVNQSQYSAYSKFVTNKATILLGTQRDVLRVENKQKQGKVEDVIVEPLTRYTDLVQFLFLSKSDDFLRKKHAEMFARFMLEDESQRTVQKSKMFAVKHLLIEGEVGIMSNITPEIIGNCEVLSVFEERREFDLS